MTRPILGGAATLLLRADASSELGGGHVLRLVALADWHRRRGGRCLFALGLGSEPLHGLLHRRGHEVATVHAASGTAADVVATTDLARAFGAMALVVDGPFAGLGFERDLLAAGAPPVAAIDDGGGRPTAAHLLINPNAGAESAAYTGVDRPTQLLLGPRFALLRPEFTGDTAGPRRRPACAEPCLLISFGAADPSGGTARVLRALPPDPMRVVVVLGAHHPSPVQVLDAAADAASIGHAVEVLCAPPDMAQVMTAADAAVSAGGGTLLELACIGCPALAFVVADNQRRGCRALVAAGCAAGGDDLRTLDDAELARQIAAFLADDAAQRRAAATARLLVDGRGAGRVLAALDETATPGPPQVEARA